MGSGVWGGLPHLASERLPAKWREGDPTQADIAWARTLDLFDRS